MTTTNKRLLNTILDSRKHYGGSEKPLVRALKALSKRGINDPELLAAFHEQLLFLRAYPPNARVLEQVEAILKSFMKRVSKLRKVGVDLSPLDEPEVSGIAGTSVTSNFSYPIVSWLVAKYSEELSIDWDWFENEEAFAATMPRFLPLLDEDAMVEAHVPYRDWLRLAAGRRNELAWLLERLKALRTSEKERARLYDSLKLHVRWEFDFSASRTGMKLPRRKYFFHRTSLIQRRDISLVTELASPAIAVEKLSQTAGEKILDLARATSAVRYRELHGFTYGDSRSVVRADLGRGAEAFVMGVPPEHRLPLRAYHAALVVKNAVPVAYFEGLSLFERMESGFNLYYTFRDGETAWLFARMLRLMRQLLDVTVISIDPYQVGHENEEGIESGAFWFYRKLGFRPVQPELMKSTLTEEKKIQAKPGYRTSARTLRKLAAGHMLLDTSNTRNQGTGEWDRFEMRNIGFTVQRHLARAFSGDSDKFRSAALRFVARALSQQYDVLPFSEMLENFAPVLALIHDLPQWTHDEKLLLARIIKAKAKESETLYLKLMRQHKRLRSAMIALGK